jgi:hypothetical protein
MALDIVLWGNKRPLNFWGRQTELCNRIMSMVDLLNPTTWLADDKRREGLILHAEFLADQHQLFTSDRGRIRYAPETALEGDTSSFSAVCRFLSSSEK